MTARATGPLWTAAGAAAATAGAVTGAWAASGVAIDSRAVAAGDLFVALKGPNFDGHDFVADALGRGAVAAMVERLPDGLPEGAPLLRVADTLRGLEALGRAARARCGARIAAITGSLGKTGTKEALARALAFQGATHASAGSLNNHWGVPLSLSRLAADVRHGVFEIGMNHAGEIEPLVALVRPHVAVVTTVEAVHLSFFASVEAIADAKAEIFSGVEAGGIAVLNRDNAHFARLRASARARGIDDILDFGSHPEARVRLGAHELGIDGSRVEAFIDGSRVRYRVGAPGRHWVMNSLAVLAAVRALGADVCMAAEALADLSPPKGRGARETVPLPGGGGFELVDESYNASPPSIRAALENLGRARPGPGGRRIAVLGDMLEMGPTAPALHAGLAPDVARSGADLVFLAGANMARLWDELPAAVRGAWRPASAELAPLAAAAARSGDVVMVKGSLGSRMALVVKALRERAARETE